MLDVDANAMDFIYDAAPCENVFFRTVPKRTIVLIGLHLFKRRTPLPSVPYIIAIHRENDKPLLLEGHISAADGLKPIHELKIR